jgi:lysophospholipase L1-like esterase
MPIITSKRFILPFAQLLLAVIVVTFAIFLELPGPMIGCLTLLFATASIIGFRRQGKTWEVYLAWGLSLGAWLAVVLSDSPLFAFEGYFVALAAGVSATLLLAGSVLAAELRFHWRLLGVTWTFGTVALWISGAYLLNQTIQFYLALLAVLALLIVIKFLFRLPPALVLTVNTAILFAIGLPLADLLTRPSYQLEDRPDTRKRLYSYAEARKNPTAFEHWWYYFVREWEVTKLSICMPATNSPAPFRLRPGTEGMMFESKIRINQLGFRGPEIPREKGDAYRIVTLGESTTFGHTMYAEDRPWPRVLEQIITNQLSPQRPVQVINAGIPSYTLHWNIERLKRRILDLQPDMIISYHGYNGFNWLTPELPPVSGRRPPKYLTRPLKLLADAEYRFKVMAYRREVSRHAAHPKSAPPSAEENEYVRGYRELVEIARTNNIRLVLANYSMAVNAASELDVIAFYRAGFPNVHSQIKANELHSQIVANVAKHNPDISYVNTHPALDGQYDKFIDLVHFTQEGRELMAEAMFNGIRPVLEMDLN